MSNDKNYERMIYAIPTNTASSGGTVLNGNIKTRNLIECGIFSAAAFLIWLIVTAWLPTTFKIVIFCFFNLPIGILSLVGIRQQSLGEFLKDILTFSKKKRVLLIRIPEKKEEPAETDPKIGIFKRKK